MEIFLIESFWRIFQSVKKKTKTFDNTSSRNLNKWELQLDNKFPLEPLSRILSAEFMPEIFQVVDIKNSTLTIRY